MEVLKYDDPTGVISEKVLALRPEGSLPFKGSGGVLCCKEACRKPHAPHQNGKYWCKGVDYPLHKLNPFKLVVVLGWGPDTDSWVAGWYTPNLQPPTLNPFLPLGGMEAEKKHSTYDTDVVRRVIREVRTQTGRSPE